MKEEVFFMQGVTEQTVKIPLITDSSSTGEVLFYVGLEGKGSKVSESKNAALVHIVDSGQAVTYRMARSNDQSNPEHTINQEIKATGNNTETKVLDKKFELSTANKITLDVDYSTSGRTWTTGSGCDKKTHSAYDIKVTVKVGNTTKEADFNRNGSGTIELEIANDDTALISDAEIEVSVCGSNGNDNACVKVKSVTVHYPGYRFKINNATSTSKNSYSTYNEKQYYKEKTSEYVTGKKLLLGDVYLVSDDEYLNEMTFYKPSKITAVAELNSTAVTSFGVEVSEDNTECLGVRIKKGQKVSDIIPLYKLTFDKSFINTYKDYMSDGNVFDLYPVIQPKVSSIYLARVEGNNYYYTRGESSLLQCTMLDAVKVESYTKGNDRNIETLLAATITKGGSSKAVSFTEAIAKEIEEKMSNNETPSVTIEGCWKDTVYKLGTIEPTLVVPQSNNNYETAWVLPTKDLLVYAQTDKYSVRVMADWTDSSNLEKVKSQVKDEEGNQSVEETYKGSIITTIDGTVYTSSPEKELIIEGVKKGELLKFTGITATTVDGKEYKLNWIERTGDIDGDGAVDSGEKKNLQLRGYESMKANSASRLNFNVGYKNTILMYGFEEVNQKITGILQGNILGNEKEIFTGIERKEVPLAGATIIADDQSVISGENKDQGKGTYKTDGYYYMERAGWRSTDYLYVNVIYKGLTYSFTQNPGMAEEVIIPTTVPIYAKDGTAKIQDENGNVVDARNLTNGDHDYTLEVTTASTDVSVVPKKAVIRLYDNKGAVKKTLEVEQTPIVVTRSDGKKETVTDTGNFKFTINPEKLELTTGTTVTMQFIDQNGVAYYEHPTGIYIKPAMGVVSFLNSTTLSGAGGILGAIDTVFDMGWSGNFDEGQFVTNETYTTGSYEALNEYGQIVTVNEQETVKTISFGFAVDKDRLLSNDYKKGISGIAAKASSLADAEQDVVDEKQELRKLQKENADEKKIEKQKNKIAEKEADAKKEKEKYDKSVEENNEKKRTKVNLAVNASLNVGFALNLSFIYDDTEGVESWYFRDMVLSVEFGAGVSTKFVITTPVGLDVILTIAVGLDKADAVITLTERDATRYYIQKPGEGEKETVIDFFDNDMDDAERALDYNGAYQIAPKITLIGKVGSDLLSTSIGIDVSALFDLYYFSNPTKEDIEVLKLNGGMFIEVIGFKKRWDFGTAEIDLSGSSTYARSRAIAEAMTVDNVLYDSVETMELNSREYLKNRGEWNSGTTRARIMSSFNEQVLLNGIYTEPDVQFADLGANKVLAIYVDAVPERTAINNTAVYYTVYDGSKWSKPAIIKDDGTVDDAPVLVDLGEKGIMAAWSSADKVFDTNADVIDVLRSRNIETALFDKASGSFGEVKAVTKTTGKDVCGDVQPALSYYSHNGEERLIICYSKNEYSKSGEADEALIGDALNPISVIAYQYYDFEKDTWRTTYTEAEKDTIMKSMNWTEGQFADYQKAWYGQGFLNMIPNVSITETLDEYGYWASAPVIVENKNRISPIVVDSDMITYNGLGIFAYVVDKDANLQTESDRDIYAQIYDYVDNSFTHPIIITADAATDSKVKFARVGGHTYLSWLSDDEIKVFDLTQAIKGGSYDENVYGTKGEMNGQPYYYLKKQSGSGYLPPYTVTSYATDAEVTAMNNPAAAKAINDYDIQVKDDYLYVLWTESENVLKDGVESGSVEAQNPDNFITEQQIYASRMDITTGNWSGRVKVSDTEAALYGNLDFSIKDDGSLMIMAQRSFTTQIVDGGYAFSTEDETTSALVSISVMPEADAKITSLTINRPQEGTAVTGSVKVKNDGFKDESDLTVQVADQDGNILLEEEIETLESGKVEEYTFEYTLPKSGKGETEWNVEAKLVKKGEVLSEAKESGTIVAELSVTNLRAEQENSRDLANVSVEVANSSDVTTPSQTLRVMTENKELTQFTVPELAPGESTTLTTEVTLSDTMFRAGNDKAGNRTEILTLTMQVEEQELETKIVRMTPANVWDTFQKITNVSANEKNVKLKGGEYTSVSVNIESDDIKLDEYTSYENYGIKVFWTVDDKTIAQVSEAGTVKGLKNGSTVLRAYIMPDSYVVSFDEDGNISEELNLLSLTSDVFRTVEIPVTVKGGAQIESGDNILTGDTAKSLVWIMLLALSGATIVYVKKRKEEAR